MTVVAAAVIPFSRLLPISPPPSSLSWGSRHRPLLLPSPPLSISLSRRFPRLSSSSQETNTSGSSETLENQEQEPEEEEVKETETGEDSSSSGSSSSPSAVAKEIKEMLAERKKKAAEEPPSFIGGVAEEVREIEWPAFSKVVGTTGVVLAVIAGSSVALLTVNAVLAELSDRFFAGKGLQDFF